MGFDFQLLENAGIQLIDGDRGKNYPKHNDFMENGYCLFLSAKNVTKSGFQFQETLFINETKDRELRAGKLKYGDIVLTTRGTVGNVAYYDNNNPYKHIRINSGMIIIRADNKLWNPKFLYFILKSELLKEQIINLISGSAVPQLPARDIRKFILPVINRSLQNKITNIISDINDKVNLNIEINQTLEKMSQTLFKSWFVDFDPVIDNALDAGNPIPEALQARAELRQKVRNSADFKPLPTEIRSLFPSEFEETELGWVPKGWQIKSLDHIANFQNGLALQKFRPKNMEDDYLPVLKIADLRAGQITNDERARTDISDNCKVYDGDMIFSWSGTLMIDIWTGGNAALNQHLYKVTSKKYPQSFYFMWTIQHLSRFQHIAEAKAVTMGHIKKGDLSNSFCLIPTSSLITKYDNIVGGYLAKIKNQRLLNNQMTALRDTLLPKLISGELSLDDIPDLTTDTEAA